MDIKDIIKQAIDVHLHIGPEIIPRKYDVASLIKSQSGKIGGAVLKNHFYPTSPFIKEIESLTNLKLFGSVVLNNFVGGLNPEAIYATNLVSNLPIVVWLPTINAQNFVDKSEFEIANEWVNNPQFKARKAKNVKTVRIKEPELTQILKAIIDCRAILATGHISWQESVKVIEKAKKMGIKKILITHPIYQRINMPIEIQKKFAVQGCFIEQSYSMYSIDKISISEIAKQIKRVGYQQTILSSDVGQLFSPSPSEALTEFARLLETQGITRNQLYQMLVINPKLLLGID